jgi:hypothetical protein
VTTKQDLQNQIAALQAELVVVNRVPDDTFNLGTVVRFVANSNTVKWHYIKTGIELWKPLESSDSDGPLVSAVIRAIELLGTAYFEVYVLTPANTPWFTSS